MLTYATLSKTGGREVNEDAVGVQESGNCGLFVLADGLGSYGHGDVASTFAVEQLLNAYRPQTPYSAQRFLLEQIQDVQMGLLQIQQQDFRYRNIRTTIAIAYLKERELVLAHVGDSRIYLFGVRYRCWRTLDHSVPQLLALSGKIRESQIAHHPDRGRLLNALGGESESLKIDISMQDTEKWRAMLLCSDGFWEFISQRRMLRTLYASKSCQEWLERMETFVVKNARGRNMDNYSAIAVWL